MFIQGIDNRSHLGYTNGRCSLASADPVEHLSFCGSPVASPPGLLSSIRGCPGCGCFGFSGVGLKRSAGFGGRAWMALVGVRVGNK